jgi:hypothetical protein
MADNPQSPANSAPIGYRSPPPGFAKGQSGNPAGRPRGARNKPRAQGERLRSLMLEEAYRPVKMSEDGAEITLPMAQAVFRTLAAAAAKGDARAQATFLKLVGATEDAAAAYEEMFAEAQDEDMDQPKRHSVIERRIVDPANGTKEAL